VNNSIEIKHPLVSIDWLAQNISASNLIVLDATIKKVTENSGSVDLVERQQIKNARFLDIENKFSDRTSELPNTMLSPQKFSEAARLLGINNENAIIVYDDLGIYSSPRVWWMFKAMGHHNIAVLDGGLPAWVKAGLPCEKKNEYTGEQGNFITNYTEDSISDYHNIFTAINNGSIAIMDARSENRFNGTAPEPRKDLRSGHIPTSINLPYTKLIEDGKMIAKEKMSAIFNELGRKDDRLIFSCGSGITACILALGAEITGRTNISVYDGSWTEWGSLTSSQ